MTEEKQDESGEQYWRQVLQGLSGGRLSALGDLKDLELIRQALFRQEAERLTGTLGRGHPRVQGIEAGLGRSRELIEDLEDQIGLARVRLPKTDPEDILIHGRILDVARRGMAGLRVAVEDEDGNEVQATGCSATDAAGYYALVLVPAQLEQAGRKAPQGVQLVVRDPKGEEVYRHPEPFTLAKGARHLLTLILKRTDLSLVRVETNPRTG